MKSRVVMFVLVIAAAAFALGMYAAQEHAKLNAKTAENLSTAMHGEAFAYAKYLLYAEHARKSGDKQLADLFEKTAKVERLEHLREEAELAGLVGSDKQNVMDSIHGESYEVDTMYREFEQQAREVGDAAAADRFAEIRKDEMKHRDAFQAELKRLDTMTVGQK